MNIEYSVHDYKLYKNDNGEVLLYTPEISAVLKHPDLIALLEEIQRDKLFSLTGEKLDDLLIKHKIEGDEAKEYLKNDLKLLSPLNEIRFKKLFVLTEDQYIKKSISEQFSTGYGVSIFSSEDREKIDSDSLVIVFQSVYSSEEIEKIYKLLQERKAWVITSYTVHHHFDIDSIYQIDIGMPCHFCSYQRYQQMAYSSNGLRDTSWINFYRRLLKENIHELPSMNLGQAEIGLINFWLNKTIKNYLYPHGLTLFVDDPGRSTLINLQTGQATKEHAAYWAFCSCLNG